MNFETRHKRMIWAMWASMAAYGLEGVSAAMEIAILGIGRPLEIRRIQQSWSDPDSFWLSDIADLFLVASVLTVAIMFFGWLFRAVKVMQGHSEFRWTPKWSIAYWIIPIANLFRPYQVMRDLMDVHDHSLQKHKTRHRQTWWFFWIAYCIVANGRWDSPVLDVAGSVTWLASGYFFIPIFKAICHADEAQALPSATADIFS
jgi:hypothetical protein